MNKDTILKLRKLCYKLRVLYVEDDKNISEQLYRILKRIFNNIDIAYNGRDGLIKYEEHQHDIVITDISMPIMDGIEMSHKIKKIKKNQVIVVTSAHSEMNYMSKLIDIGVNKFILKPIDLNSFLELLARIAVKIFKDKQKMKDNVFADMDNPIAIMQDNKLEYVNDIFRKNFLKDSDGDISEFNIGYIFKDNKMLVLDNKEILEQIMGLKKVYKILHVDSKIYKTYKIDVMKTEEENQYLWNFINIDFIIDDLEKSNINNVTGFQTRKKFLEKLHYIHNDDDSYNIFCFGLKNSQEYIKEYGAKQMNSINSKVSLNIEKEFSKLIKNDTVNIYLFNTNRYILVENTTVNTEMNSQVINSLKNFGNKYKCTKGRPLSFNLDFIVESVDKGLSQKEIIDNTEAMIYMLKD